MLRVTLDNISQQRTIRPLYAHTQATPWGGYLDPSWARTVDIYPGMVMTKLANEVVTLANGTSQKPFGLSALFVAPALAIDEVRNIGVNVFTVWVLGPDSAFEVLAPAFDVTADYTQPTDGTKKYLSHTLTAHPKGPGLLTVSGGASASSNNAAELLSVVGTSKIIVKGVSA